ncbi:MAG: isoprenyl transferase [candidate division KSB1 bacterium]|nr:isoprenyl transferase [candidate division KSB1 bacterium]MDZ7319286.1 isoprenyl transferase [candidate division KSB1 bacterium]MDZ7340643.1 isoprenyl transferase [candidate division KSB1 bacterium]
MSGFEEIMMDEEELKAKIQRLGNLPVHVAIIMDGNGRWAKARNLERVRGHQEGINSVRAVVEAAGELGIEILTLYTFSKENWRRPKAEVSALWRLLLQTVRREVPELKKNNVRLRVIGVIDDLPRLVCEGINYAINELKDNTGLLVNLALSYSSRLEITHAVQKIARKVMRGEINPFEIDEKVVAEHLYTGDLPDPDLMIRTSGEQRISNFLLWQLAYSEFYITNVLWPDFRKKEFYRAILAYQQRERRYGMVSDQVKLAYANHF